MQQLVITQKDEEIKDNHREIERLKKEVGGDNFIV